MAGFPSNPTNAQQVIANGIVYVYNSSKTAWVRNATTGANLTANSLTITSTVDSISPSTGALTVAGGAGIFGTVAADKVWSANNGLGTNFKVGDDAWFGDINVPNTVRLMGQQNNSNGYMQFGSGDTNSLGRSGTGPLTWTGNFAAGNIAGTLSTAAQTNITSVGTLSSLAVTGTVTAGNVSATNLTGTLSTAAQTNITSVGTLGSLTVTGNVTAAYHLGDGSLLTGVVATSFGVLTTLITSGNLTVNSTNGVTAIINGGTSGVGNIGTSAKTFNTVFATSLSGTLTTAAQTNITSVGTLTNLTVTNTITGSVSGSAATVTGAAQTAITSVGTLTALAVTGNVAAGNVSGTNITGTLTTAAQTNITSVGTLTALAVTGNVAAGNVSGTNITGTLTTAAQTNITSVGTLTALAVSGAITVNSTNGVSAIINGGTTGTGNIGSATVGFNTVFAKATSAVYADLAENYLSDSNYEAGTVVVFGGDKEITTTQLFADTAVAGVISTNPAYLMNNELVGQPVALRGRVPVKVQGFTRKGDLLVTGNIPGVAISVGRDNKYGQAVFAKALEIKTTADVGVIEAVII